MKKIKYILIFLLSLNSLSLSQPIPFPDIIIPDYNIKEFPKQNNINQIPNEIDYKIYNSLPCAFNNAQVTSTATPLGYEAGGPCCPTCEGYKGKMGTTIEAKRGTPVVAIHDMELLYAKDTSAQYHCMRENQSHDSFNKKSNYKFFEDPVSGKEIKCRYPFDNLEMVFITNQGYKVLYYHLMPDTPLVPGFGIKDCKPKILYDYNAKSYHHCGGLKKSKVKKGEIIGYVGHATVDHISINIDLGNGYLTSPESKNHKIKWENYSRDHDAFLLPIIKN